MKNYDLTSYFGEMYPATTKAIIMVHGGGTTGYDIVNSLEGQLPISDFYTVTPNTQENNWFPNAPLSAVGENEPFLTNSLSLLNMLFSDLLDTGFKAGDIYLLGFSDGACLVLEFAARNAGKFGGIYAFSGCLPGAQLDRSKYSGNFCETPVYLSCHETNGRIPRDRVHGSSEILSEMGASVYESIYPGADYIVSKEEIAAVAILIMDSRESLEKEN